MRMVLGLIQAPPKLMQRLAMVPVGLGQTNFELNKKHELRYRTVLVLLFLVSQTCCSCRVRIFTCLIFFMRDRGGMKNIVCVTMCLLWVSVDKCMDMQSTKILTQGLAAFPGHQ